MTTTGENMQTQRQYLYGLGLAKAPEGRGRFSAAAHEALTNARARGVEFSDDNKPEKPKREVKVKVKGAESKVTVPNQPTEKVDPVAVRKWAKENGHEVGARGRIHGDIKAAYLAATPKDERPEVSGVRPGEKDIRPALTGRYPKGTTFKAEFTYRNKDVTQVVNDRTACYNCGVSLSGHLCDNPKIVTGYGSDPVAVSIILPKG